MSESAKIIHFERLTQQEHTPIPRGLENVGVGLEGLLEHYPIDGIKKQIKLNRTQYEFMASDNHDKNIQGTSRNIRTLRDEQGQKLTLKLKRFKTKDSTGHRQYYQASSNTDFRLNGQWVSRATLRKGDVIDFALNRFVFDRQELLQKDQAIPISTQLIRSNLPILIEGETGTGKTTLAKRIHEQSQQSGRFVHLNLASFSTSLIESELFGHIKGAFTGAVRDKSGAFVEANLGTLFLDEIDSLPLSLQTKLLLFLDDGFVRPVGSTHSKKVKTRIIAASGSSLKSKVKTGSMRADFYHRLASGAGITLPSLREKPQVIEQIVRDFCREHQRAYCNSLVKAYSRMPWPGNIRQLHGHLFKKHISNTMGLIRWDEQDDELALSDANLREVLRDDHPYISLRELKKLYSLSVLAKCHYHFASAAKILNISVNTLKAIDQAARIEEI